MHIALLVLPPLAFASCSVKELADGGDLFAGNSGLITVTASMPDESRTVLDETSGAILWSPGEKIKLFSGTESGMFTSTNTEPARTAQFTGSLSVVLGGNGSLDGDCLLGMYPYRESATSDGKCITLTHPKNQLARTCDFAEGSFISIARSGSFALSFYNLCGGLKFTVAREGIKRVSLRANGGETLSGKVKVDVGTDSHPFVSEIIEGVDSLVLCPPTGETFIPGKTYYISCLPVSLSGGFTMRFYASGFMATRGTSKRLDVKRSIVTGIGLADSSVEYVPNTKMPMTFSVDTE